jgi:S-adenosylmethionine decarboxylase
MNGKHLLVNGKNVTADVDDESLWREVFDKTVDATKTTKMRDFDLVKFPEKGVTAFLVLGESHISVHTYPEDNAYYFDVFSCKDFNVNEVVKILISTFGNHDMDYEFLER